MQPQNIQRSVFHNNKVKQEWYKFIDGKEIDKTILSPLIWRSWKRSYELGVDPYYNIEKNIIKDEKLAEELTDCTDLIQEYGQFIYVIREMANEMGLICRICDEQAITQKILATPDVVKENINEGNYFAIDASEKLMGTNAICLALIEKQPIQVIGAEHFNYYFHNINCSAAPLYNTEGEVRGVLNISTNSFSNTSIQTLGFAISIAQVLDYHLHIKTMLNHLNEHTEILSEIMERFPSGILYFDRLGKIKQYNTELLNLLNITKDQEETQIKRAIHHKIETTGLKETNSVSNREILINVGNTKKSLLATKKVVETNDNSQSELILFDSTDRIFKLHDSLKHNSTYYTFQDIFGQNVKFRNIVKMAQTIANSNSSIVIYGESGTGKELFAQAIHNASDRKSRPFVGINCGAIPSELIESELFGYESGAFTGASTRGKYGQIEIASGGTLFLDEIENMPLNVQIKLLRVLSTNKVMRIGGTQEIPVDVRVISSTKKDLLEEVRKGNFREDLFYRINVFTLELPSLRERIDDIPVLVRHYTNIMNREEVSIDNDFLEALSAYHWPGNLRELRNVVERAIVLLGEKSHLTSDYLPDHLKKMHLYEKIGSEIINSNSNNNLGLLHEAEVVAINHAISKSHGNLTNAAKILGIARSTLYDKMKKLEIET